jgi:GTP cyclohydrolase II
MRQIDISQVAKLPTIYGTFNIQAFKEADKEHLAIYTEDLRDNPIVRVHSECLTGDALGSKKCDCGEQLAFSQQLIAKEGGMIIYHRQEGRNIGLLGKVNAYALQDKGFDTVEANHQLGFKADERTYEIVEYILEYFNLKRIQLLTNNPSKIESLKNIEITKRIPIIMNANPYNKEYLEVKKNQMGHLL